VVELTNPVIFTAYALLSASRQQRCSASGDAEGVSLILILSDINMPGMTGLELLPKWAPDLLPLRIAKAMTAIC
jgi:CheY-like chemotaxis protein